MRVQIAFPIFCFLSLCGFVASAEASVTWTLSNVEFHDGAVASGTFVTNDSGIIQSWDIATTGGSLTPEVYDSSSGSVLNAAAAYSFNLQSDDSNGTLILLGLNNLLAANSPDTVLTNSFEQIGFGGPTHFVQAGGTFVVTADVSAPEPMSVALFATGIAALVISRRKKRPSAP
jgi:hypothetical protein